MKKMNSFVLNGATRGLIGALIALFGLGAAMFAFVGFVPIGREGSHVRYGSITGDITYELFFAMRLGVSHPTGRFIMYGSAVACCVVAVFFFLQLYRIVTSVGRADPFTAVNARRLACMGWMLLVPVAIAAASRLAVMAPADAGTIVSMGFVVLASLVLLILAGVFRLGAAMREDLEGIV